LGLALGLTAGFLDVAALAFAAGSVVCAWLERGAKNAASSAQDKSDLRDFMALQGC
jgi:hypothetical protein